MAESPQAVGRMLERHWGAVFAALAAQEDAVDHFLSYSVAAPADLCGEVGAQTVAEAMRHTSDSMPGLDGSLHTALRSCAEEIAPTVADAMRVAMNGGSALPEGANLSVIVFLPKAPPQAQVARHARWALMIGCLLSRR